MKQQLTEVESEVRKRRHGCCQHVTCDKSTCRSRALLQTGLCVRHVVRLDATQQDAVQTISRNSATFAKASRGVVSDSRLSRDTEHKSIPLVTRAAWYFASAIN